MITRERLLSRLIRAASAVFVQGTPPVPLIRYWQSLPAAELASSLEHWSLEWVLGSRIGDPSGAGASPGSEARDA